MKKGKIFVVSGPSGAGKTTLVKMLKEKYKNVYLSISATTRPPRLNDLEAKDYYFLNQEEFVSKIENDEFLEYAKVHDNFYGTLKKRVMAQLDLGEIVLLEIDIQGGFQVKEKILDTVLIFITTSKKQLQNRLEKRGTDSGATITKRLKNGCVEKKKSKDYDHIILNDDIENALKKLEEIIVGG